jgi:hypothetical protein
MRWRSGVVSALVVLLALGAVGGGLRYGLTPDAQDRVGEVSTGGGRQAATLLGSWPAPKAPVIPTQVADAIVPKVALFTEPNVPFPLGALLDNPTHEGLPVVFDVLQDRGSWLKVAVSTRPNGTVAWVKASDVVRRTVPNKIRIELGAHRLTVVHGDAVLMDESVVIGTPEAPTPLGVFFVDGIVDTHDPGGVYGPIQMSVSGFSNVLTDFGGGIGQIAIHGTNQPELRGTAASHGCIRITNDAIMKLTWLAPTGTPVEIVA